MVMRLWFHQELEVPLDEWRIKEKLPFPTGKRTSCELSKIP
jgi:hypothetical protein